MSNTDGGVIFCNNFVVIFQEILGVHCMGEENHMRMMPIVFNSIISSHKIFWSSLEITLACHSCRGWSTAEWKRERKDEIITVLPYAIGQGQTKSIYIWRWRWFISHFSAK